MHFFRTEGWLIFYVYMLQCADQLIYTGYTVDLEKRLAAHNAGKASRYTRSSPVILVYHEVCKSKSEAMQREAAIKKLTRAEKLKFIHSQDDSDKT